MRFQDHEDSDIYYPIRCSKLCSNLIEFKLEYSENRKNSRHIGVKVTINEASNQKILPLLYSTFEQAEEACKLYAHKLSQQFSVEVAEW